MTAKQQAVSDIYKELSKQGKCFIAFYRELDAVMDELVNEQIKAQESCQSSK